MKDHINFKGHFKIQAIDTAGEIVDEWEEDNLIMEDARETMSELFSNLNTNTFINKITLGTLGHVGDSIVTAKGKEDGFVKERDRLFSEAPASILNSSDIVALIRKNDIFNINVTTAGYYKYIGDDITSYLINDTNVGDTTLWEYLGATAPYNYTINFDLPGTNASPTGTLAASITEDDVGAGSTVTVLQTGTSVKFTFDFAPNAGNLQNGTTSIFTEAALYSNNRIFSMKTFKAKIKDSAILLRIVWTITF